MTGKMVYTEKYVEVPFSTRWRIIRTLKYVEHYDKCRADEPSTTLMV